MTTSKVQLEIKVGPHEAGLMLKEIIYPRLNLTRGLIRRMKNGGGVYLNGRPAFITQRAKAGDLLLIVLADDPTTVPPQPLEVDILYQDDYLLAVNKPPGMAVYPTGTYPENTLVNGIAFLWQNQGLKRKIRLLHRLDRETSGVILIGKDAYTHQIMVGKMVSGQFRRGYLALIHGNLPAEAGEINAPIGLLNEKTGHGLRRGVLPQGKPAQTFYQLYRKYPGMSLVQLELGTGRTHQIRVHLQWLGCPLMGDSLYGRPSPLIDRQALHAWYLEFTHPYSGELQRILAPLPSDMANLLEGETHFGANLIK